MTKQGGIKDVALGRSDTYHVDPRILRVKPDWNSRETSDPAYIAAGKELTASIKESGVKQPLTVYWEAGEAWVSDGHRRLECAMRAIADGAELKTVPVRTEDRYADEGDRVFSQIVRNSGLPLTPFERGKVFKRLVGLGWTEVDIAKKSGITRAYVVQLLELQAAPEEVRQLVRDGTVSASLAGQTLRARKGDGAQAAADLSEAVQTAQAAGKTRATAKHVSPKPSLRAAVRAILATSAPSDHDTHRIELLIARDAYTELCGLVGFAPADEDA